jgi:hypothetical protein
MATTHKGIIGDWKEGDEEKVAAIATLDVAVATATCAAVVATSDVLLPAPPRRSAHKWWKRAYFNQFRFLLLFMIL